VTRAIVTSGRGGGQLRVPAGEYLGAAGIVAVTAAIGLALRSRLSTIDMAMLFLLGVVVSATRYRRRPALLTSILAITAFDFVFVPPYYTLDVHDTAYVLTFAMMLLVAIVMSHLTARIREQGQEAVVRERRTNALLDLDRKLGDSGTREELAQVIARHVGRAACGKAAVVLVDETDLEHGIPRWPANDLFETTEVRVAATWAYQQGEPAGWGTGHCGEAEAMLIPIRTATASLGVMALRPEPAGRRLTEEEYETVAALGAHAAAAIDRTMLSERSEAARVEAEAERLRISLLSSLSHDLRTPLATIEGAASTLLQQGTALPPEVEQDMAESILEESRRMTRLVSNLLDMIRVETGALAVQKAWQPLEEALGVALLRLDASLSSHAVDIRLPADLPLVPIDELLIEQVFINLLENAIKYTPPSTPISVEAWQEDGAVMVEVADGGAGIAPGSEEAVFRKFYRAGGGSEGGAGLGLTICRGIITAHGGRIWVEQRSGKGAAFRFTIPLQGPPLRGVPVEAED
jgi:two-component system, OmpR family, sensor histidine kinase KdpD